MTSQESESLKNTKDLFFSKMNQLLDYPRIPVSLYEWLLAKDIHS
jgi:hypothetical protein